MELQRSTHSKFKSPPPPAYAEETENLPSVEHRLNHHRVTKNLSDKATSAVLFNSSTGDWFRTTLKITTDALEDHEGTVTTGGRTIPNLRFADDIDG